MKVPISYYGGKQSMVHFILPRIPLHKVYNEPFFGGGTVFWKKEPVQNETINDKDDFVVNFYRVLQTNFRPLKRRINESLMSRSMHHEALKIWHAHRARIKTNKVDAAWAFWMLTNFSFACKIGGGIKYSNDQGTVVTAQMKNKKDAFTEQLVERIERTIIENSDFSMVINSRNVKEAFHYLDPPYPGADQGHYKGFTWDQYEKLLTQCESIKGKFMLSNYNSPMLDSFIKKNGWVKVEFEQPLLANRRHHQNKVRKIEVLVMNYNQVHGMLNLFQ